MNTMRIQALKSLSNLLSIMLRKSLAEKLVSQSTLDQITSPINGMDWSQKKQRAEDLIHILETSRTEEEILQRAEKL